jgi:hypothetical protein
MMMMTKVFLTGFEGSIIFAYAWLLYLTLNGIRIYCSSVDQCMCLWIPIVIQPSRLKYQSNRVVLVTAPIRSMMRVV